MNFTFFAQNKIRLDELLRSELPRAIENDQKNALSHSKIRRLILSGSVFVDGVQIRRPAYVVFKDSKVNVLFDEAKFFFEKQPSDVNFVLSEKDVLFEDAFFILVNKPAFFPVEEAFSGAQKRNNLHDEVVRYMHSKNPDLRNPPYCGVMHRLDRETSGVILFTKQRAVNKAIHRMFEDHNFKKVYTAVCCPHAAVLRCDDEFTVENYIGRISPKGQRAKWGILPAEKGGLYSKTNFKIVDEIASSTNGRQKTYFVVQAEPVTGRTHQIRVHLSGKGLPILGDTLYGGDDAERVMLHASRLEFSHPVSGAVLSVKATCPFYSPSANGFEALQNS